jgi:hypothetical protein
MTTPLGEPEPVDVRVPESVPVRRPGTDPLPPFGSDPALAPRARRGGRRRRPRPHADGAAELPPSARRDDGEHDDDRQL